ncbi:hypothetical protein V6N12_041122 [Hibiscus sabdariffa]|uniref:Transmembrane protein n=1 Tax=Hibiscus sabdariffa TaxID=183260 RepID=A0ABR2E5P7_9ROSI
MVLVRARFCLEEDEPKMAWVSKEWVKDSFWTSFSLSSFLYFWVVFGLALFAAGYFGAPVFCPTLFPFHLLKPVVVFLRPRFALLCSGPLGSCLMERTFD